MPLRDDQNLSIAFNIILIFQELLRAWPALVKGKGKPRLP